MYYLSVDLAQLQDYTALAAVRQVDAEPKTDNQPEDKTEDEGDRPKGKRPDRLRRSYQVGHLERLEKGMSYVDQVRRIRSVMQALPDAKLIVDATGVGAAVVDMLAQQDLKPISIWIHGGEKVTSKRRRYRVPKRELAGVLQVVLSERRLEVQPDLPNAQTLRREMQNFKAEINRDTGHETYAADWREGDHDDLVLSVAMACWYGERNRSSGPGGGAIIGWRGQRSDARMAGHGMDFGNPSLMASLRDSGHPGVVIR